MKLVVTALGVFLQGALLTAPLTDWTGSWRLDRPASRFRGDVTRIERTRSGYRFDLGAVAFILPDDGKFHPTIAGRETRLARLAPNRWEREHRINGRIVDHSVLSLSNDGRTLLIAGEHAGRGPERLVREGIGNSLAGTWRSTRLGINVADETSITAAGDGRMRWGSSKEGNWYVVQVGGGAATNEGPTATSSATLQMTLSRQDELRWTERIQGRPYRYGTARLSRDGQSMIETVWPAGSPAEKQMLVYRRVVPAR